MGLKVLIVEDDLVSRVKLATIMEELGQIQAVETGRAAIEAFQDAWRDRRPFDLICLDVELPDQNGTEVLFEIRSIENRMNLPKERASKVLMTTSHKDKDTVITSIQAGCDDYLVKPFTASRVFEKIRKLGFKMV
jgi:two-component system chemotaxis response regulator CheY